MSNASTAAAQTNPPEGRLTIAQRLSAGNDEEKLSRPGGTPETPPWTEKLHLDGATGKTPVLHQTHPYADFAICGVTSSQILVACVSRSNKLPTTNVNPATIIG
jgi:hypothetical protein